MGDLEGKGESFAPYSFVQTMRQVFPMFDERDDKGHHKQQDADECYIQFLSAFQQAFRMAKKIDRDVEGGEGDQEMIDETNAVLDPIERLFGIELESTVTNSESETEAP